MQDLSVKVALFKFVCLLSWQMSSGGSKVCCVEKAIMMMNSDYVAYYYYESICFNCEGKQILIKVQQIFPSHSKLLSISEHIIIINYLPKSLMLFSHLNINISLLHSG